MTASIQYLGGLRTKCIHIKSGSEIQTDAPTDNKGKGMLFSPTDLLATSLVSCMITVMAIKGESLNIVFRDVSAEMTKIMASNPRRIAEIQVKLFIKDSWSEDEREILEKTGLECPVALSLSPQLNQSIEFVYLSN